MISKEQLQTTRGQIKAMEVMRRASGLGVCLGAITIASASAVALRVLNLDELAVAYSAAGVLGGVIGLAGTTIEASYYHQEQFEQKCQYQTSLRLAEIISGRAI